MHDTSNERHEWMATGTEMAELLALRAERTARDYAESERLALEWLAEMAVEGSKS